MSSSFDLFQKDWQDFFREALEDREVSQMLRDLIAQRERLIARVTELASAKGRGLTVQPGSDDFVSLVIQRASQQGSEVTEADVLSWLQNNGLSWSSIAPA